MGQAIQQRRSAQWTIACLALAHCSVDIYSSALGALQPYFLKRFALSLTQAGILGGVLVLFSYILQPLFGILADRYPTRAYASVGPLIAAVFISCAGLAKGFSSLLVMVALGGIGMAMFHPQASAAIPSLASTRRGMAMGVFISAGAVGFSIGPTGFATLTEATGLDGNWIAAAPGILCSLLLLYFFRPKLRAGRRGWTNDLSALRPVASTLFVLYLLVCIRSVVQVTFGHLLPLYLHLERGQSVVKANALVSAYFAAGALGGFSGGHLADRFGGRRVIEFSMIGSVPFLLLFFLTSGTVSFVALVLAGFVLLFTIPVNVVMAQQLAPGNESTVSALMMGLAWGVTGLIFVPLTGWVADHTSMHAALFSLVVFPFAGYFLARRLEP